MQKNQIIIRSKKWISAFLIFIIFASQTIQLPLLIPKVSAAGSLAPNLVSILISEEYNTGTLKGKIQRYAEDIQKALPNTRAVIVEIPQSTPPQSIAATNEKLYYDGDGKGLARLVGTVLVGKLPIPVVHKGPKSFLSIYPYTDFDDKAFIFDDKKGFYDWNPAVGEKDVPEIWHGVIQPNTGDATQDIAKLNEFFDKTHDFYLKQGVFAQSTTPPAVFYFDVVHDQAASQPESWNAYSLYLEFIEEIAYNRYSKHLAKTLYNRYQSFQDPSKAVNESELQALGVNIPTGASQVSFSSSPDIQTRTAIEKTVKQFFQVFNEKHVGDTLKFIFNTGRYGDGEGVNADYAPVLISKRDEFMKRYLKDANTAVEDAIDSLVKGGLSRDLLIPTKLETTTFGTGSDVNGEAITPPDNPTAPVYKNYYFGLDAANVQSAKDCTIVRGSSLMVEANRGYNVMNSQKDVDLLSQNAALCFSGDKAQTWDFWGGNSPLNLDTQSAVSQSDLAALNSAVQSGTQMDFFANLEDNPSSAQSITDLLSGSKLKLVNNRYKDFVLPAFDLLGQNEIGSGSVLTRASPLDCRVENMIADPYMKQTGDEGGGSGGGGSRFFFYHPVSTQGTKFACVMRDSRGITGHKTLGENASEVFEKILTNTMIPSPDSQCTKYTVNLEGGFSKNYGSFCTEGGGDSQTTVGFTREYSYKKVPSWIEHKSPNDEEYAGALKGQSTPSLAHDKDRYIDFILPSGAVQKIEYPNFFRLTFGTGNISQEDIKNKIKEVLDAKSAELNSLIQSSNPSTLPADKKALYDVLKRGEYPSTNVNLYTLLSSNTTLFDTLVDTLHWYNQGNATSKYAFTLENYLDIDGNRGYPLAGHKSDYELAYIGGPGDAANMYVKVDPAAKSGPPEGVSAIQADYQSYLNVLNASNISDYNGADGKFQCGPPEGVPIWKWLPAVFCWLKTILPPTITSGSCKAPAGVSKKPFIDFFFGKDTNRNGKPDIQEDSNKNGVLDGLELIKDGEVVLTANKPQLSFNDSVTLKTTLKLGDKILAHDSENIVQFDVKRVTLKSGTASNATNVVVYAKGANGDIGKIETLDKYIGFKPLGVPVNEGEAEYVLTSKTSEVNVTLEAWVAPKDRNGSEIFKKVSNEIVLEVRNESLAVSTQGVVTQSAQSSQATGANSTKNANSNQNPAQSTGQASAFEVGSVSSLSFKLQPITGKALTSETSGKVLASTDFPIEVQIFDDVTNESLVPVTRIQGDTYSYSGDLLTKAGIYRFEFVDATGRFGSSTITLMPGKAVRLDLAATSSVYVKGQKNLLLVRAIDAQGNTVTGKTTKFDAEITGGGFFVENKGNALSKTSVEGYASFEISTNEGGQNQTIKISHTPTGASPLVAQIQVSSIDDAKVIAVLEGGNSVVAGSSPRNFSLTVAGSDGSVLTGFNGIASVDFPKNSGKFSTQFVEIKNGKSNTITFTPGTLAIADASIDISIPGIKTVQGGTISVVPASPMRVEVGLKDSKLEAKNGNTTEIVAKLYDRFGNLAYNHPAGLTVSFTTPEASRKYAQVPSGSVPFAAGIARSTVGVTDTPGTAYYIAEVTPSLETNTFSITDESGATMTVKGFSKATGIIESYYLWNKSKIDRTQYNALVTQLLGADYGNVTVKNYLAGEILFNPGSRSLSVVSLLNHPTKRNAVMSVTPGGKLTLAENTLSEVVASSAKGKTAFDLYDPFRKESIGRLYLNLKDSTPIYSCPTSNDDSIDACDIQGSKSYILMKGIGDGVNVGSRGNSLVMSMESIPVFEISRNGTIWKNPLITVEADAQESRNFLSIGLKSNGVLIGRLAVKFDSNSIGIASADTIDQVLASTAGSLVYESTSPRFTVSETFLGNTSYGAKGIQVLEPTDDVDGVDRELIGSASKVGLEQYSTKQGIGFGEGNNSLLEFASQSTIGESTRASATYSQIVLGDPVARLPELSVGQSYDRTLGKRLTEGYSESIESYAPVDYNGDGQQDIVVFYENGKVELLQNFSGTYRSLGNLLSVVDAGEQRKVAGDFAGDGFGDIVMVDKKGQLIVIDNRKGKYTRVTTRITNLDGTSSKIQGAISQLESFDMDKDGKMDLVYSDDAGELAILYGAQDSNGLYFQKKLLDGDIGLKLSNTAASNEGAIRWRGITEVTPPNQETYLNESASGEDVLTEEEYRRLLDNKVYYLQNTIKTVTGALAQANRIAQGVADDPNNPGSPNSALAIEIQQGINDITALSSNGTGGITALQSETVTETRTFLRSEFADGKNLLIEKTYTDKNAGSLQGGDRIQVSIRITNSGSTALQDVEYLDSFDTKIFSTRDSAEYSLLSDSGTSTGTLNELTDGEYIFHFKGMSIGAGRSAIIQYEISANSLKFGTFKVGILETDDQYGDVAMNANSLCGDEELLWKSIPPGPRDYQRTIKKIEPSTGSGSALNGKYTDFNANGQPDYIDLLSGSGGDTDMASNLWDPTTHGVLVFREIPNAEGVLDGQNFEYGRIVGDASKNYVQSNGVSGKNDVPVLAMPGMTNLVLGNSGMSVGNTADISGQACGSNGTTPSNLRLTGAELQYMASELNSLKATMKIRASGQNSPSGSTPGEGGACIISLTAVSDPVYEQNTTKGLGWKILTKRSFSHFALAGTQANVINTETGYPDRYEPKGTSYIRYTPNGFSAGMDLTGLSSDNVDKINSNIDTIVQGLGCGFGGGSCLSLPFNWAPLAPGSAPTVLGFPLGPLTPNTGLPVFSMTNFKKVGRACVPMPWPPAVGGPGCIGSSAGGWLGTWSPANNFRLFITPTITGAVGVAACFGGPAMIAGNIPPMGVSPIVPGGNCVVAATPLLGCKDDGSDGNIDDLGISDGNGTLNAGSCKTGNTADTMTDTERRVIAGYAARRDSLGTSDRSFASDIVRNMNGRSGLRIANRPLLSIGGRSGVDGSLFEIGIDPSAITSFNKGSIVKISQKRVSAFPDFIMDWVNRQLEEVANKLTSLPTLYIIKPDFRGALDTQWTGFSDKLAQAYAGGSQNGAPVLGNETAGRQISGIKAAYSFLSRIPLIRFEKRVITVAYPSVGEEDLDKIKNSYNATLAQWEKEIATKKAAYARLGTQEGIDASVAVRAEGLVGGIRSNIEMIETYKKYPEKLAKYLTWKERYAKQILCNVLAIQALLDGFITSNAIRFKAWVEFGELIKNILKGWQIIPDLFYQNDAECGVCRNERYDLKHFIFKLVKAIIPPLPIIRFPKWPDIILDLHNVRLGLRIPMPEFVFQPTPIVLPTLPKLFLPSTPRIGFNLPSIPTLPQLPPLPDLPNIPALPLIKLPELPPPPTIPKLFGAIKFTLNILKIIAKVMCIMRMNPFVPEWRAGDQIAQITERQGKLSLDFLNIEYPQLNFAFIDAIKVTTYVNFEFRLDFIMEMAKAAVEPLNSFNANLSNIMSAPASLSPGNVNLRGTVPRNIDVNVGPTSINSTIENNENKETMSVYTMDQSTVDMNDPAQVSAYAKFLAHGFAALIAQGQNYANQFAGYEEVRENLAAEVASVVAAPGSKEAKILASMSEGLKKRYDAEAEAFAKELKDDNARKFKLATDYIEAEERETKILLERVNRAVAGEISLDEALNVSSPRNSDATLVGASDQAQHSTESPVPDFSEFDNRAREAYGQMLAAAVPQGVQGVGAQSASVGNGTTEGNGTDAQKSAQPEIIAVRDESVAQAASELLETTRTYTAAVESKNAQFAANSLEADGSNSGTTGSNVAEYQYKGIYAKDNGKQIRLFDYTEDLLGTERAISVDRLGNGKIEYIYKSGEILYLKTQLGNPAQSLNDSVDTVELDDILGEITDPTAPNHFKERFSSAGEINLSFKPARSADKAFRLTFFDYIDRYARMAAGESLGSIQPQTESSAVDLIPEFTTENQNEDTGFPGLVSRKPFGSYTAGLGEVRYKGPTYRVLGAGQKIRIGAGKSIYTGAQSSSIRFSEADAQAQQGVNAGSYSLDEKSQLDFLVSMDIEVMSGEILLPESNPSTQYTTVDIRNFRGYPVLPETQMETDNAAVRLGITYYNGANSVLAGPFTYQTILLGSNSDSQEISVRHENGWYYAQLEPIIPETHSRALIRLLSPQLEADKEAPLMNVSQLFRAPVYQEKKVNLVDAVTDNSGLSDMFIDLDLTVDSNSDGKKDNDRDSDAPNAQIHKGASLNEFTIAPQTTLFEKTVKLWAYDQRGNVTSKEVPFKIYAPIPSIQSSSGSVLYGQLDERLQSEPVDIIRYRNGGFKKIGETAQTDANGAFSGSFAQANGAELKTTQSGTIAKIDEFTGVITLSGASLRTEVIAATENYPMQIFVKQGNDLVYTQAISLGSLATIESIRSDDDPRRATGNGARVSLQSGYSFVPSSPSAPTLPSGAYIVDSQRKPVVAIGKDGNIYTLIPGLKLEYTSRENGFGIKLLDKNAVLIGTVWYSLKAEYIIK